MGVNIAHVADIHAMSPLALHGQLPTLFSFSNGSFNIHEMAEIYISRSWQKLHAADFKATLKYQEAGRNPKTMYSID